MAALVPMLISIETAKQLKGQGKRVYMARVVKILGRGGQTYASQEYGWDRKTIRKGRRDWKQGAAVMIISPLAVENGPKTICSICWTT